MSSADIRATVEAILDDVRREGEPAVRRHCERFDSWSPPSFRLALDEAEAIAARVPADVPAAIDVAAANIRRFAEAQLGALRDIEIEIAPGLVAGHRVVPVAAVGAYIPFRLVSSALMSVLTAKVAGVPRVAAAFPPGPDGPAPATEAKRQVFGDVGLDLLAGPRRSS